MKYETNGWDVDELYKFIRLQLDLYILLLVPPRHHIKDNLRDMYVYFIISQILGMTISSKLANCFVADMLGYTDLGTIHVYKGKLKTLGWFTQDKNKHYKLIQNFNFTAANFNNIKSYNFNAVYVKKKDYKTIDSKGVKE